MLSTCKANGVPGETGWPPLLRLGWRKSGYRMGNGARNVLCSDRRDERQTAAVLLANQAATYRNNNAEPPTSRRQQQRAWADALYRRRMSSRKHSVSVTQQILALANLLPAPSRRCLCWRREGIRAHVAAHLETESV